MLALILGALLAQAVAPAASSAALPPKPSVVTQPDWVRKPVAEDLAHVYPDRAIRTNQGGRATIECKVSAAGVLEDCHVIEESPGDLGFGDAAMRLAPLFTMRPMTKDGTPVGGGTIRIPIRFILPGGPLDAMSAELSCYGQAALLAEKQPESVEAWTAVTFFSAQVAVQAARAKSTPKMFEDELANAHRAAAATKTPSPYDPELRKCLDFASKNMKPIDMGPR